MDHAHLSIGRSLRDYWKRERAAGLVPAMRKLAQVSRDFLLESLPERKRRRYGDTDYDWEMRVDTTSATVSWSTRLLGLLNSPYQPIEPQLFREVMESLEIDFSEFIFIDVGSGKGRALLLAAEYPFRQVIGIELLAELNAVAEENIRKFAPEKRCCGEIQTVCVDATSFRFLAGPIVVFLFNPLPEAGLSKLLTNLDAALHRTPCPAYVIYVNPEFEQVFRTCSAFSKVAGANGYSVFRSVA